MTVLLLIVLYYYLNSNDQAQPLYQSSTVQKVLSDPRFERLQHSYTSCGVFETNPIPFTKCRKFTHYVLAIQRWCDTADQWGLHGLWPEYEYGKSWPQYCYHLEYEDISQDIDLINDLNKFWKTWDCKADEFGFYWEWIKHGTCMIHYMEDLDFKQYLKKSMQLLENAINDGTLTDKCGDVNNPKVLNGENNQECWEICYDLEFNYADCNTFK